MVDKITSPVSQLGLIDKVNEVIEELVVDTVLSAESTNPVQNKVVTKALMEKSGSLIAGTDISVEDSIGARTVSGSDVIELKNVSKDEGLNYVKLFGKCEYVPDTYIDSIILEGGTEQLHETYLDTVTLSGGCEQRNLPAEYTQVEYLESDGTQYIDTGIVLKSEATITTVGQNIQSSVTSGPYSFWGFMGGNNNIPRWGWSIYQNRWLPDLNATSQAPVTVDTQKHTFINTCYYNNNVLEYDSLLDGNSISNKTVENPTTYTNNTLSAYLFARNNNGTAGNFSSSRIFSYEIVQDGIKVLSLIPCKRNSDSVLGMYDTVTGNFLTNQGTGTFTAGADVVPTPETPIDIVCNNGILKVSPNLFNKNLVPNVNEYINRSNGNLGTPSSGEFRHSDYITIKENTQYYVGVITSVASSAGLAFYDDTKTYISGISLTELGNNNNIITSPADTKYIRFSFRTDEGYNTNWQNTVYFVEGNQPLTEFMPYGAIYTDGTTETVTDSLGNTATAERLLAVGDYKDTQEVLNGSVTRNVGIKVLDGTESWTKVSAGGTQRFYMTLTDSAMITGRYNVPITHFHFDSSSNDVGVGFLANQILYLYQNPDWTGNEFKSWLADQYANGTPVIIVYPTSSATTETVPGQLLSKSPVTQTAGSISNLPIAITESQKTTPTPSQPLQINCNNGVLKLSPNLFDKNNTLPDGQIWSNGTGGKVNLSGYYGVNPIKVKGGHTYTRNGSHGGANYFLLDDDTSFLVQDDSATITVPDNAVMWYFNNAVSTDRNTMMIVEGSSLPAEYIPYGQIYIDGTTETVEVTGKNLFDVDHAIIAGASSATLLNYGTYIENGIVYNGGKIGYNAGSGITIPVSAGDYTFSFVLNGEVSNYE